MFLRFSIVLGALLAVAAPAFADDTRTAHTERAATQEIGPDEYISRNVARVLEELGPSQIDAAEREDRFRHLVNDIFDTRFIARFILGSYWEPMPETERTRFMTSLVELQVQRWAQRFKPTVRSNSVVVGEPKTSERGHHLVPMTVSGAGASAGAIELLWVMRKDDDRYRVFDVIFAGVSVLTAYREEYQSFLSRNGDVAQLIDEIEKQTAIAARS